ncbi:hypothetical protein SAMN05216331_11240 [Porphyromonadaceae bacterium KH3R12]|jgi:hypothetical protein|nr:hypothetical protein [Bacteroidota bacterium]SDZ96548.1 hypothetical protein SAMN05216331_11240 [Porphyromonadaceae bacterium KH3R12]
MRFIMKQRGSPELHFPAKQGQKLQMPILFADIVRKGISAKQMTVKLITK